MLSCRYVDHTTQLAENALDPTGSVINEDFKKHANLVKTRSYNFTLKNLSGRRWSPPLYCLWQNFREQLTFIWINLCTYVKKQYDFKITKQKHFHVDVHLLTLVCWELVIQLYGNWEVISYLELIFILTSKSKLANGFLDTIKFPRNSHREANTIWRPAVGWHGEYPNLSIHIYTADS